MEIHGIPWRLFTRERSKIRRSEKRLGTEREKSPSITKIRRVRINNIAEQIIVIYILKINGERLHIFRKWGFLDFETSGDTDSDFESFLT